MTSFLDSASGRVEDDCGVASRLAWDYRFAVAPMVSSTSAGLRYVAAHRHMFSGSPAGERELARVGEAGTFRPRDGIADPTTLNAQAVAPGGGPPFESARLHLHLSGLELHSVDASSSSRFRLGLKKPSRC